VSDEKLNAQYEALNGRVWEHTEMLWQNVLAYGAVLGGDALAWEKLTDKPRDQAVAVVLGALVLWFLGVLQIGLARGLRRACSTLVRFEAANGYEAVTAAPSWTGLFGTHAAGAVLMTCAGAALLGCGARHLGGGLALGALSALVLAASAYSAMPLLRGEA
jgi:hypothetical protein